MKLPSIKPTRTAPTGPWNGMSDSASAQLAPLMPSTSGSFSLSAEYTNATTWVSLRKASGNSGRIGRSIWRLRQNFLLARPSFALDEAAGNASTGVRELAILDRQREEVDAFFRVGRSHRGGQHGVVAAGS